MMMKASLRSGRFVGLLTFLAVSSGTSADTITVEQDGSGDYTTIGAALAAASKGDFVVVGSGAYTEDTLDVPGWSFFLVSSNGPDQTFILPANPSAPIFVCDGGPIGIPLISGFTIMGADTATDGGAMRVLGGSQVAISNCVFDGNQTDGSGGAVWVDDDCVASFATCVFRDNTAGVDGGALAYDSMIDGYVTRCLFEGNTAGALGGGARFGQPSVPVDPGENPPNINNSIFLGNTAGTEGGGIHIYPTYVSPLVGEATIENCTLTQNTAPNNGGISLDKYHLPEWTGGLYVFNTISYYNEGEPLDYRLDNGRPRALPDYSHSCSDELSDADDFSNTPYEPRFRDRLGPDGTPGSGDEDLRVLSGSPCIDRGDNVVVTSLYDYDGTDRILDDPMTPDPIGVPAQVDMGAYEFDVSTFGSLNIAFWTDDSGKPTPMLDDANWYDGVLPQLDRASYFNGYPSFGPFVHYPEIEFSATIGELNVTEGAFIFSGNEVTPPVLQLASSGAELWADFNIGTWTSSTGANAILSDVAISCNTITIQDGTLQAPEAAISLAGDLLIDGEDALFATVGGGTIQGVDGESTPTVRNLGSVTPGGVLSIQGTYAQSGDLLDGTPATGNLGFTLALPDEQLNVDGVATLGGGATFYFDANNLPAVGSQFTIATATGGFGGTTFDYVLTAQSTDGRFVVVSYPDAVGGGDSAVATVLSPDSLLQGSPETQALGVTLSDVLLADIDGDDLEDMILSIDLGAGVDGSVAVLLNEGVTGGTWNGFESFGAAFTITVGKQPRGLDCGFADEDDQLDVVVANYEDGTVSVLSNASVVGTVSLAVAATLDADPFFIEPSGPLDVWVGNLDGDAGNLSDILVTNELDGSVICYQNVSPLHGILFGNPLKSSPQQLIAKFKPGIFGGGREEGPLGNGGGGGGGSGGGSGGGDGIESGSPNVPLGSGIVMTWTHYDTGAGPVDIDSGDLNDDGLPDAVTTNKSSDTISVLLGAPGDTFAAANTFTLGTGYTEPESVTIGDFDGDGDLDLSVVCMNGTGARVTKILRNTLDPPTGSYGLVVENDEGLSGLQPYLVRSADVDDDGDDDIIALTETTSLKGGTNFGFATTTITEEVCIGDFDGSGTVDGADLASLLGAWGTSDPAFDLNGSGLVEGADLATLLGAWGPCEDNPPLD